MFCFCYDRRRQYLSGVFLDICMDILLLLYCKQHTFHGQQGHIMIFATNVILFFLEIKLRFFSGENIALKRCNQRICVDEWLRVASTERVFIIDNYARFVQSISKPPLQLWLKYWTQLMNHLEKFTATTIVERFNYSTKGLT